ncbi:MAG: DUF2069 domain-containing protein [Kistimonas sp.]|nr:DUF2069 domain-containing protein [Kistimonas sp.]
MEKVQDGQRVRLLWILSVTLYCLLIMTMSVEHWMLVAPALDSPWLIWSIRLAPLLVLAPSIFRRYARSFVWLCFVLLFYFSSSVVYGCTRQTGAWLSWVLVALCAGLFTSALLYVRCVYRSRS